MILIYFIVIKLPQKHKHFYNDLLQLGIHKNQLSLLHDTSF